MSHALPTHICSRLIKFGSLREFSGADWSMCSCLAHHRAVRCPPLFRREMSDHHVIPVLVVVRRPAFYEVSIPARLRKTVNAFSTSPYCRDHLYEKGWEFSIIVDRSYGMAELKLVEKVSSSKCILQTLSPPRTIVTL